MSGWEPGLKLRDVERRTIRIALKAFDGREQKTATELGIKLSRLKRLIAKYDLHHLVKKRERSENKRKHRECLGGCRYKTGVNKGKPVTFKTTAKVRKCKNCRRKIEMDMEYEEYSVHL